MRRLLLVMAAAALMAVMLVAMAAPAFAGNAYARGQDNSNPGFVNDAKGDAANDVANLYCNPTSTVHFTKGQGEGCANN